jgi:hypothetical protein
VTDLACPPCGSDTPAGMKFCGGCGQRLAPGCPVRLREPAGVQVLRPMRCIASRKDGSFEGRAFSAGQSYDQR